MKNLELVKSVVGKSRGRHARLAAILMAGVAAGTAHGAMVVLNYDPEVHDRFDSTSFLGGSYDWSGVARSSDNAWATLVSASHFVSTNHFKPLVGSTVTFFEGNDSNGTTHVRTVVSGQRIGNTDIWVGRLDSVLPSSITYYDIASTVIDDISTSLGAYADQPVFHVGLRDVESVSGTTNFALGINHFEIGDSTAQSNGSFDAIGFVEDRAGDPNLNDPGETFFRSGDSGAPSFVDIGGRLTLVGLHSYTVSNLADGGPSASNFSDFVESQSPQSPYQQTGPQTRDISYDNFVPNYRDEIVAVIPEPSPTALATVGLVVLSLLRRRREG